MFTNLTIFMVPQAGESGSVVILENATYRPGNFPTIVGATNAPVVLQNPLRVRGVSAPILDETQEILLRKELSNYIWKATQILNNIVYFEGTEIGVQSWHNICPF